MIGLSMALTVQKLSKRSKTFYQVWVITNRLFKSQYNDQLLISILASVRSASGIFFGVLRGRNSAPFPMGFRWLFSQFEKKIPNLKKKKKKKKKKNFFFFFFFLRIFIQSPHTHTHKLHDDNLLELHPIFLQFNGNSMCNS